ncbi:VOC family protein [Candidatus Daviesbacteria bacterium]|nr:VOC family protein [Candidatus Daviesbacteria bacterium]
MFKGIEAILIGSENATNLANFYRDKVGLEIKFEAEMGEEDSPTNMYEMGTGGVSIYIMDHKDVKGKSSNPQRVMFNLEVDEIEKNVKELEDRGVKKVQDIYHVENYGYIATFEDLDGNYFQLVKTKE